jgi:dUTP pyrophosphatase
MAEENKDDISVVNEQVSQESKPVEVKPKKLYRVLIKVKKIKESDVPVSIDKGPDGDFYHDLYADLTGTPYGKNIIIPPGQTRIVPINLVFDIPKGYEIQVRPGMRYLDGKAVIQCSQSGIPDSTSKYELNISISNLQSREILINHGQKIGQIVITPVLNAIFIHDE